MLSTHSSQELKNEFGWLCLACSTLTTTIQQSIPINCTVSLLALLSLFSRNSTVTVFYWKSANLIGSPTVLYSLTENDRACIALSPVVFLDFKALKSIMLGILDCNPLEFLLKQLDYQYLPSFYMSDNQPGYASLTIRS